MASSQSTSSTTRPSEPRDRFDPTAARLGAGWHQYLRALGPGLVTGASDDDPSGIATYSQAGAQFGLSLLWVSLVTLPLMAAVQEICDRAALATGQSLGELAVKRFGRWGRAVVGVLVVALLVANTLNIAADLVAVGSGMTLLHLGPTWMWALGAGVAITLLLVLGSFDRIALVFKVLCAALVAYLVVAVMVTHNWATVVTHTLVPHVQLSNAYLALLVAVLGTTISPYLFFWQGAHRLEEMRDEPEGGSQVVPLRRRSSADARRKQRTSRLDVFAGMTFSNLVMFAIIVTTSQTLHVHGRTNISSASEAAQALRPLVGHFASALFAIGFIGSGLLAIPVLAGAGSIGLAGLLGKRWGFSRSIRQAPLFYGLVIAGSMGGMALSLVHVNPIRLLVLVAVINGIAAGPFLVLVMIVTGNREIMGTEFANGRVARLLGWTTASVMFVAAGALFATGGVTL